MATQEISKLAAQIEELDKQYWQEGKADAEDWQYDRLVERLRSLDPSHPLLQRLNGQAVSAGSRKVKHLKPMLSLAKAYSFQELLSWAKKHCRNSKEKLKAQPKYDGLSGVLEGGKLSSRGDGLVGEDYTDRMPLVKFSGPLSALKKGEPQYGELLVTDADFQWMKDHAIVSKAGIQFKNQRNGVSGLIGCDDVKFYTDKFGQFKPVTFVDYESLSWEFTFEELTEAKWEEICDKVLKAGFPIDGVVLKLADEKYSVSLGSTAHHPHGAIAFKFTNAKAWTKLTGVTWSMGKDQIACIGQVEPVDISGVTVKNVKLQVTKPVASDVQTYLLDGSLQIGDDVLIERAGDIIPHVVCSKPGKSRQPVKLEKCPFCGGPIEVTDTAVRCLSDVCRKKGVERVLFAMITLGFKGVGEKYAGLLYDLLYVRTVEDLLQVNEAMLRGEKFFGDKMVDIFLKEQAKAQKAGVMKLLVAMNIPSLGQNAAKLLLKRYSVEDIMNDKVTEAELLKLQGIGPVSAKEIAKGLKERHKEVEKTLQQWGLEDESETASVAGGDRICFTGKMSKTRGEMEALAKDAGFEPASHVDKTVKWLVCADPASGSSKMKAAAKLGCKVISEEDFMTMINK